MIPKFRAWLKEENKMIEPSDILSISFKLCEMTPNYLYGFEKEKYDFYDLELMQSTGFEDNCGDAIFEGDIILWTYWEEGDSGRAKIIFDNGMFKLLDICTEKEVWDDLFDCNENCDIYIQGNIYENPELLVVE